MYTCASMSVPGVWLCVYYSMCTLVDVVCGGIGTVCECTVYIHVHNVYTYHTYVCTRVRICMHM